MGKTWDVLEDKGPQFKLPETAMAANPTCMQVAAAEATAAQSKSAITQAESEVSARTSTLT